MEKELFLRSVEAIQKQIEYDISVSKKLGEAFPDCFTPNLLPKNHLLQNALLEVLQVAMNDTVNGLKGMSWIEYFCFELEFGKNNDKQKVTDKNDGIPM